MQSGEPGAEHGYEYLKKQESGKADEATSKELIEQSNHLHVSDGIDVALPK